MELASFILSLLSFILGLVAFIVSILFWKYGYKYYKTHKELKQMGKRWQSGKVLEGDMNKITQNILFLLSEHPEEISSTPISNKNPYFDFIKNIIINCNKDS